MNTGQIINSKTNGKFTVVPNDVLNGDLTFEEKGLLISLLSLPADWVIYRNNLYDKFPDKPGTIDRIFQQLQKKGYIVSVRVIDYTGHFIGWNHIVYNEKRDSDEISRKPQLPTSVNTEIGEHRNRQSPKSVITEIGKRGSILKTNSILNTNYIQKTNEERDLAWFKNQLDDIFLDRMKLLHSGKNIELAIKESFGHLLANEIEKADKRRCQTLLNSWLSNQKPSKGQGIEEKDFLNLIK
jgi:hypothetical protein